MEKRKKLESNETIEKSYRNKALVLRMDNKTDTLMTNRIKTKRKIMF